jgi:branched-chain amino acid aminotransferase
MAGFTGVKWAPVQMYYNLNEKHFEIVKDAGKVPGVSRSVHYGIFLAFEGIRFFCKKEDGELKIRLLNWDKNLQRFIRSMSFNLSREQQTLVPTQDELVNVFVQKFLACPEMRPFLEEMAEMGAQGYLRPYTVDEDQSIGVTFPVKPTIRAVVCRYESYLGEPFSGVVIPHMVRAMGINGTGHLKLGVNYLISIKAVDEAKRIFPGASSALFLDDQPHIPLEERKITEWDSSCCLIALRNGTVIKIPESPLILPSVTINGMVAILRDMGVNVEERDVTYGELIEKAKAEEIVAITSVGTAGIMNRCSKLLLVDGKEGKELALQEADEEHTLFKQLGEAKARYWDIYRGEAEPAPGMELFEYWL